MNNTKSWDLSHLKPYASHNGNIYLSISSINKQFHSEVVQIEGDSLLFLRTKVIKHPLGNIKRLTGKNLSVQSIVVNSNPESQELKMTYSFFNEENELIDTFCFEKKMDEQLPILKINMICKF
jgi:hypothetical protein